MRAIVLACISVFALTAQAQDDSAWSEQKITASDGRSDTYFGTAAAVSGSMAVIGAYGDSDHRGAAYIETKAGTVWSEAQKIVADDSHAGDEFGYRVAMPGLIFVTAYNATIGAHTAQGAAYVFDGDFGFDWAQLQKLTADDGATFDNFGQSIAVDGDTVVIGANGATVGDNGAQGAAYVFVDTGSGFVQQQKLVADDGAAVDNFGVSAAIGGTTLFIGSPYAATNGHAGQGAVYVFSDESGTWTQVDKLLADDGNTNANFGMAMSLDGTTLIVGATGANGRGAAYVFDGSSGTWTQTQKLVADDGHSGDNFGDAIGLSGSEVLIAADVAPVGGNTSQGAGYLFALANGTWTQTHKFTASDGATDDFLGAAAAYDGDTVILSSPHPVIDGHAWQGAAYFYSRDTLFADGFDG